MFVIKLLEVSESLLTASVLFFSCAPLHTLSLLFHFHLMGNPDADISPNSTNFAYLFLWGIRTTKIVLFTPLLNIFIKPKSSSFQNSKYWMWAFWGTSGGFLSRSIVIRGASLVELCQFSKILKRVALYVLFLSVFLIKLLCILANIISEVHTHLQVHLSKHASWASCSSLHHVSLVHLICHLVQRLKTCSFQKAHKAGLQQAPI